MNEEELLKIFGENVQKQREKEKHTNYAKYRVII